MKPIRTHTFNGRKYKIDLVERIDGVTDIEGEPDPYEMLILDGNDMKALHSAIHEGFEAIRTCDKCVHGYMDNGYPKTWDIARLVTRLGWHKH